MEIAHNVPKSEKGGESRVWGEFGESRNKGLVARNCKDIIIEEEGDYRHELGNRELEEAHQVGNAIWGESIRWPSIQINTRK